MNNVISLNSLKSFDPKELGSKGAGIAKILTQKFDTPDGFIIPCSVFVDILGDQSKFISDKIQSIKPDDLTQVQEISKFACKKISSLKIKKRIISQIESEYSRIGSGSVSVRSSSISEDLIGASFAGQYRTELNITGIENIVSAILRIWASTFSANVISYRLKNDLLNAPYEMAVLIQKQLNPNVSGVMFTRNPINGDKRLIISAAYGLGEGVVTGEVESDHFEVDYDEQVNNSSLIRAKTQQFTLNPLAGVEKIQVSRERVLQPTLSTGQLNQLGQIALELERVFQSPQDIEFAVESDSIKILQSRPITSKFPVVEEWDNRLDRNFTWELRKGILGGAPAYKLQIDIANSYAEGARECYTKTAVARTKNHDVKFIRNFAYIRHSLGNESKDSEIRNRHSSKCKLYLDRGTSMYEEETLPLLRKIHARLRRAREQGNLPLQRLNYLKKCINESGFAMGHLHWCSNVRPDDFDWAKEFNEITGQPKDKAKIFLQSIPTPTTKLVKKMRNLAVIVQGNQLLKKAFYEKDFSIIDDPKYQNVKDFKLFNKLFKALLKTYGYRWGFGFGSAITLTSPTWNMKNEIPLELIRLYSQEDIQKAFRKSGDEATQRYYETRRIRRFLAGNSEKLFRFEKSLKWAQDQIKYMEGHNHLIEQNTVGQMRDAIFELGKVLVEKDFMSHYDDVIHFSIEELESICEGKKTKSESHSILQDRKEEFVRLSRIIPPDFLGKPKEEIEALNSGDPIENNYDYLIGEVASTGMASGNARVITENDTPDRIRKGDILVSKNLGPDWTPYLPLLSGIVLDEGDIFQHPAIIAREYSIPAIFQTKQATTRIKENQMISINSDDSKVILNDKITI